MDETDKTIEKRGDRFVVSQGDGSFTFVMVYDQTGVYLGQYQDHIMGDGLIFLSADIVNGLPCVNRNPIQNLTPEEMAAAS